jgi:hypothetical protein
MTRYLVTWKAVNARRPENMEVRVKQNLKFTEMVQDALKSGALKDFGISLDGNKGYGIFEGTETAGALMTQMYVPFYEFEATPMLTADQWVEVQKSL